jgi:hypothetical protein
MQPFFDIRHPCQGIRLLLPHLPPSLKTLLLRQVSFFQALNLLKHQYLAAKVQAPVQTAHTPLPQAPPLRQPPVLIQKTHPLFRLLSATCSGSGSSGSCFLAVSLPDAVFCHGFKFGITEGGFRKPFFNFFYQYIFFKPCNTFLHQFLYQILLIRE